MKMKRHSRSETGSMLVLMICIFALVIVPLLVLLCRVIPHFISGNRVQSVVEAASLLAANDLSRIVINDEAFGYVALSNYPPVGRATRADDGEALPVVGVNNLIGTLRQNSIIADELNNETMESLVDTDAEALESTITELKGCLSQSVSGETGKKVCRDIDGNVVTPLEDAEDYIRNSLPPDMQLDSVRLSMGWLDGGSPSQIKLPQPIQYARIKKGEEQNGTYQAFKDFRIGKHTFSFAGVGSSSTLVPKTEFHDDDGQHFSSILKLECTISLKDDPSRKYECVACAQPYALPDREMGGGMTVRFPGRPVAGLMSWNDFLCKGNFNDNKVSSFDVEQGDYPFEHEAQMKPSKSGIKSSTSEQFAECLYYWLRNGRLNPRIDSVLAMINEPFGNQPNQVYSYAFEADGSISRTAIEGERFLAPVTADGQFAAMSDTKLRTGVSPVIFFRNNVKHMGTEQSKHAGQPLAGYPLKGNFWGCVKNEEIADTFSKRDTNPAGLALDIEVGGTRDSSARADVMSMIERTRGRKI